MRILPFHKNQKTIDGKLWRMTVWTIMPMCVLAAFLLLFFVQFSVQNSKASRNITVASTFNLNFKDEVDLKMYYFVTGSSDVLPLEEVETARQLAMTLRESTQNRDSLKVIDNILSLCDNLDSCIREIERTEGYDARMSQLESNVYIITQLIERYIYTYLYYEAGEMAELEASLQTWMIVDLSVTILLVILLVTLLTANASRLARNIAEPIDALCVRVGEIGRGDLAAQPPIEADDEKLQTLSDGIEQMVSKLSAQMELNEREQQKLRETELALLQAQINPHFLYNTLDTIIWLIETGKNEQAQEMVSSLSTYFRSFLSNGKDIITLREEAQHVRSYLEIQQVRYKDILRYEISIDPALDVCRIPKMTLQPLVENAIYHGIKPKRGGGRIAVTASQEGDCACIRVQDTGAGLTPEKLAEIRASLQEDASGFGLIAAYKRLRLMYGERCTFTIDSTPDDGMTITIIIPLDNTAEGSAK